MDETKEKPEETAADVIRGVRQKIKQLIKHEERKLAKQQEEVNVASRYELHAQIADSLLADPSAAPRGTAKASLINIHTQEIVDNVALNPALDAVENAELLYRKSRKGKRGHEIAKENLAQTENSICELTRTLAAIDEITKEKTSQELNDDDVAQVYDVAKNWLADENASGAKKKNKKGGDVPFKKYTVGEWEIYLGKNSAQNDELSTRFAKPSDIWMHVAGYAGSHVIIRRAKDKPYPPPEVIEKAAQLAVWFSKAKHTSFAEVHVTEARFVRKRRHAPPGEVIAERCKTIRAEAKEP